MSVAALPACVHALYADRQELLRGPSEVAAAPDAKPGHRWQAAFYQAGVLMAHTCIIQGEPGVSDDGYRAVIEITAYIPIPDSDNAVRGLSPWITTVLPCPDCGQTMIWAERDHGAWHRICNGCGSHWTVTPADLVEDRQRIVIERARFFAPGNSRGGT